jgi:hypothetical protein
VSLPSLRPDSRPGRAVRGLISDRKPATWV